MSDGKKCVPEGELNDEALDAVTGGVQAGIFTEGGHDEFGTSSDKNTEETEEERRRRLMRQAEGKGYL